MGLDIERQKIPTLVVDDDRDIGQLVKTALDAEGGYRVALEDGPKLALCLAEQVCFRLVITDNRMPKPGDGMELVRKLIELPYGSRIRFVLITATPGDLTPADLELLRARKGVILPKPFDMGRFLDITGSFREEFLKAA